MKFNRYLKDKIFEIVLYVILIMIILIMLYSFSVNSFLFFYITILLITFGLIMLLYNFFRRKKFYDNLIQTLNKIDQKYLLQEMINRPNFIEGKILYDTLYETNKAMLDVIKKYKLKEKDFKEYIELWLHEIKTPLATSNLIIQNNHNAIDESVLEQLNRIDNLVEQVMFYVKSGNANKDYLIKKHKLDTIIKKIVKRNKKSFILKQITLELKDLNVLVNTDSKWLEFIINQIINNSIKYSKEKNSFIKIYTKKEKNRIILYIEDNGIGIDKKDIDRVFDKGFTGSNGRLKYNSTGIGLYLCHELCQKLGYDIAISSILNKGTIVKIIFPLNSLVIENLT